MRVRASFTKVRNFILIAIFVVAVFSGGYYFGVQGYKAEVTNSLMVKINREAPPDKNVDMSLFWQVWDTLSAKYYDKSKLVPSQMVYGAISGMVGALGDPYTMFLPPSQNKIVNEDLSGSFEGVGIEIGYKNTRLAVVSPLPDSPAQKAGVKAGDYIVRITDIAKNIDKDAQTLPLTEAVAAIRGTAGTKVDLTLVRDGNSTPIKVELTRAKLDVPSVRLDFVGQNSDIADIRISKFDSQTVSEWDSIVDKVTQKQGVRGIVIDLRNNPGGYLQDAIDIASNLVPSGDTVVIQQDGSGQKQEYKTDREQKLSGYKVVVLVNGGSASASEILSGALRDDLGVKLVGEKSFGKGTIQEPLDIPGGSGLHVTTAKWLTPNGTWVHGVGLTPDIEVVAKDSDTTDTQLDQAIKILNS